MVCASLGLMQMQIQSRKLPPSHRIPLALGNDGVPEMRKGSLSGLDFLEGPPWFKRPPEAILVLVVQAAAPDREDVCPVVLPSALAMSSGFTALGSHADGSGLCPYLRPC